MTPDTPAIIADRGKLFGEVALSAEVFHELCHRAGQSFQLARTLEQIGQGQGREAEWAKRSLADMEKTRPKLRYPNRLVKLVDAAV
jgi:hypothetical protein